MFPSIQAHRASPSRVTPPTGSAAEASGAPTRHPHPDRISRGLLSEQACNALEEAKGSRDEDRQELATRAYDNITHGPLSFETIEGKNVVYGRKNVVLPDKSGGNNEDRLTVHMKKTRDDKYDLVRIELNVDGKSRWIPMGPPNLMNDAGQRDVKALIADELPAKDLMALSKTNKFFHYSLMPKAQKSMRALHQVDQMAKFWRGPLDQRQAAAASFLDSIEALNRKADQESRSAALFNLCRFFNSIPESDGRQQLARRFLPLLQDLPSSKRTAEIVKTVSPHWLPQEARDDLLNDIIFPILDRLIADGVKPSKAGNPVKWIWARLSFLPPDKQTDAKEKIDAMVDAMITREIPMPELPWEDSDRPDLDIQARQVTAVSCQEGRRVAGGAMVDTIQASRG